MSVLCFIHKSFLWFIHISILYFTCISTLLFMHVFCSVLNMYLYWVVYICLCSEVYTSLFSTVVYTWICVLCFILIQISVLCLHTNLCSMLYVLRLSAGRWKEDWVGEGCLGDTWFRIALICFSLARFLSLCLLLTWIWS